MAPRFDMVGAAGGGREALRLATTLPRDAVVLDLAMPGVALLAHYRRHYVPSRLVLAVSGHVKTAEVMAQVERLFGTMPAADAPPTSPPSPPAPQNAREVMQVPGAQAQILIGALAPPLTDPDYPAMKVLSTALGGGMAGRLFSILRDQEGLAYTTTAQYPTRMDRSLFLTFAGTAPESTERTEAALRRELDRIQREPVSDEELRVAKEFLLGALAMDRRTNQRQTWYLGTLEAEGVGTDFLDRYIARVRALTAADLQRAAQRYLALLRTVVVVPPK